MSLQLSLFPILLRSQASRDETKTEPKFNSSAYRPSFSLTSGTYKAPKTPVSVKSLLDKYSPLPASKKEEEKNATEKEPTKQVNGVSNKKEEENSETKTRASTSVLKKYGTNKDITSGSSGNLTALTSKYGPSSSGISTRRNSLVDHKGKFFTCYF